MPDDTALHRYYAAFPNMSWKWRTRPKTKGWEAEVKVSDSVGMSGGWWSSEGDTEQDALDRAIHHAISYHRWRHPPAGANDPRPSLYH